MGVFVAFVVFVAWGVSLVLALEHGARGMSPALWGATVLARTYLTTGLFITAHDAMHGSVTKSRVGNRLVGTVAATLFAAMRYRTLTRNHLLHHAHPATASDPDWIGRARDDSHRAPRFWPWFVTFMVRYVTWPQLVVLAVLYNVLHLRYDDLTLWSFWAGPALLASLQLFFFGTYLPHRPPHEGLGPHRARTQAKNHAWAMLTCWFFGYHREHHESPSTPWWKLYAAKGR